jgi:hypothetical protein
LQIIPASQPRSPIQNIESSQSADKENTPPTLTHPATPAIGAQPGTVPPQILSLLNSIIETLKIYFSQYPPHTVQRLAELILSPKEHYRNLPSYIHAVDRVVHVTSPANIYPLPAAGTDAFSTKPLINGVGPSTDPNYISWGTSTQVQPSLGSDESLGGALLSPIPWLTNRSAAGGSNGSAHIQELGGEIKTENTETIDGPNGAGSIETVSVSVNGVPSTLMTATLGGENTSGPRAECGVIQGELLHQEQRAGVVPASQYMGKGIPGEVEDDEIPHARGPEEIGMEDMGPQVSRNIGIGMQGIDVEAAVGRRAEVPGKVAKSEEAPTTPKREAGEKMEREGKRVRDGTAPAIGEQASKLVSEPEDREMALVNVDSKTERDVKIGGGKENEGANAMDTTTV